MKLIIDIPEKRYKDIQRIAEVQIESNHFQTAEQIIAKGTPLEKHDEEIIKETVASIWGKPPYIELLDAIESEILNFKENCNASDYLGCGILDLIDKYRGERNE